MSLKRLVCVSGLLAAWPALAAGQNAGSGEPSAAPAPAGVVLSFGAAFVRGDGPLSVTAECPFSSADAYAPLACSAWIPGLGSVGVSTVSSVYPVLSALGGEAGLGLRLLRGFGVAVSGQWLRRSGNVDVRASMPSLIHLARGHRTVAGQAGVVRELQALHVGAAWTRVVGQRAEVTVSGGPSWLRVRQSLVGDVAFSERYPFDVASFDGALSAMATGDGLGWHVAVDGVYWLGSRVGLGSLFRYRVGDVSLDPGRPLGSLSGPIGVSQGGIEAVVGIRVRF